MKNLKNYFIILIQTLLSMFIIIFILSFSFDKEAGMIIIPGVYVYFPLFALILIAVFNILEFLLRNSNKNTISRLTLLTISFFAGLVLLKDSPDLMNIVFLIFAFIIFIILIIALIKDIKNAESIKKPDRSLPVGWFTKKSYWIYVIGIILLTFLTITFILFFTEMFFWLRFIFGILLLFIAVFFMTLFLQITPINKVLVRFEKTLNYEELKSSLDEFRKNDLAEDSRIYLDIIQANYLYMINLDEAIKILFEVKKPQNPSYVIQYYLIKLYGLLNQKDYEGFDKLYEDVIKDINEKKQNFWMKKFRDVKAIKEMHQQEVCDPIIEETFKLTGKTLFSDLANAIVLVKYYKLKKNEDEFIKYRDFILENGKPLYQLLADLENM